MKRERGEGRELSLPRFMQRESERERVVITSIYRESV